MGGYDGDSGLLLDDVYIFDVEERTVKSVIASCREKFSSWGATVQVKPGLAIGTVQCKNFTLSLVSYDFETNTFSNLHQIGKA